MMRSEPTTAPTAALAARYGDDAALALRLIVVLDRAYAAVRERRWRHIESRGLTPTEFGILEALYHKGTLTSGEIGAKVLLTSGGLTYVTNNLVKRGLVRRRRSGEDRRVVFLALTGEGERLMTELFPEHAAVIRDATAGLAADEKRQAMGLLKKLGYAARED